MFRFNQRYFITFTLLFLTEVGIALFIRDKFIRPYLGDVLVVIMLYCFVKSFLKIRTTTAAVGVLLFAFLIEMLQYFRIVELLGLQGNEIATTILGSQFDWKDVLAYTIGVVAVLITEKRCRDRSMPVRIPE